MDKATEDLNKIFQLPVSEYNFANNTKWVFSIPIGHLLKNTNKTQIDGNILQYPLNCKKVTLPDFKIGTTKTAFLSYGFDLSTRQNITDKGINIQFLVSNNWIQYLLLLKWFKLMDYTNYDNNSNTDKSYDKSTLQKIKQQNPYASAQGPIFPSSLYLMDNFNHRLCTILFEGSWLSTLKAVNFDYSNTSDTEVSSSFDLKFFKFDIILNDNILKDLFQDLNDK